MNRATENKIILITRKTRLQELVIRYNTLGQAQFFVESHGGDFSDYLNEDARYWQAVKEAVHHLERLGRVQAVDREFVPNFGHFRGTGYGGRGRAGWSGGKYPEVPGPPVLDR